MIFDVAILGGGVVGTAILNKLTRLGKKVVLIEKGSDVSVGTTKANSGIVHAGFDAKPGTLKAKLNKRGAEIYPSLCKELNVPYIQNGALVMGSDMSAVQELYDRGIENGISGLEILDREQLLTKLPNITENITCGLYAKTSGIVSPYKMAIALAEESVINGAQVVFNFDTKSFAKLDKGYALSDGKSKILAKKIILAVGGDHNTVAKVFGATEYPIEYRRGEYYLLDKGAMDTDGHTIFPLPTKHSKGILISPTVSNNYIVGPTSTSTDSNSTVTTKDGLEEIASKSGEMLNNVNLRKNIRVFSGVRTVIGSDFVIEKDKNNEDIINVTGICSPGLTAAPAIAEMVVEILGCDGKEKTGLKRLTPKVHINKLSTKELDNLIKKDGNYGKIVCRCEMVSEAEIIEAINSPLKPMSVDAVKRRTRAGMGRCQGGFCFSRVMELIAREHNISIDDVTKENQGSRIIIGDID
ncbi:MAG: NAD(P)/FAD-dependent oxidoreductase [Clostridiales bacterium]|nr:NAD(P)/FAD-dependent oxidoreductase [Clostridiales bacterium]